MSGSPATWVRWGLAAAALGVAALSLLAPSLLGPQLGATLLWSMPLFALLAALGGDLLWGVRRRWLTLTLSAASVAWLIERFGFGASELVEGIVRALIVGAMAAAVVLGSREPRTRERFSALVRQVRAYPHRLAFALWALLMIPAPLVPEHFNALAYASTAALSAGVFALSLQRFGGLRSLALFALAFGFGVAIEVIGERTGVPFGAYRYLDPGPALFGVPLLVPLGWYALTLIALAATPRTPLGARVLAPLALVAWDVGLDPLMVLKGFWAFEVGPYFGVPWSNFLGWGLAGALLIALLLRVEPRLLSEPLGDLRLLYAAQAFLIGVGLAFFGLPVAGAIAAALMALVLLASSRAVGSGPARAGA